MSVGICSLVLDAVELVHYFSAVLVVEDSAVVDVAALVSEIDATHADSWSGRSGSSFAL
jgi:hypothetical protein